MYESGDYYVVFDVYSHVNDLLEDSSLVVVFGYECDFVNTVNARDGGSTFSNYINFRINLHEQTWF